MSAAPTSRGSVLARIAGAGEVRDRSNTRAVPSLALKAPAAAAALDISLSTFLALVAEGKMPKPVKIPGHGGLALYDYEEIRDAWEALKEGTLDGGPDDWE